MRFAISIPQNAGPDGFDSVGFRRYVARVEELGFESAWTQEQVLGSGGVLSPLEAMTYARVYRPALLLEDALSELEDAAGSQFDPTVATRLVELVRTGALQVGDLQLEVQQAV